MQPYWLDSICSFSWDRTILLKRIETFLILIFKYVYAWKKFNITKLFVGQIK